MLECVDLSAVKNNTPPLQDNPAVAQRLDRRRAVAHKKHCSSRACDLADFAEAFLLECRITNREDLVDHQQFGLEVCGHRERQAHPHAR